MTPAPAPAPAPALPSMLLAVMCGAVWTLAAAASGTLGIWPAIGGAALLLGLVIVALDPGAAGRDLRPTVPLVVAGLAVGSVLAVATYSLYPLVLSVAPSVADDTARLYGAFRVPPDVATWLALIPVVTSEELVWRGTIQGAIVRRLSPTGQAGVGALTGVVLAALLYALVHALIGSPVLVLVSFSLGVVWGSLRMLTRSLAPVLAAHLLWDFLVLVWLPLG